MSKAAMPPGIGPGKPVHPFAVTVEEPVANAIVPDGYGIKYHAYHTITEGVFLPTGTSLPGGAVLPMSSVADFPMVLPPGELTVTHPHPTMSPSPIFPPTLYESITPHPPRHPEAPSPHYPTIPIPHHPRHRFAHHTASPSRHPIPVIPHHLHSAPPHSLAPSPISLRTSVLQTCPLSQPLISSGTKLPGGVMVPIVMQKITKEDKAKEIPGPVCSIQ